MRWFLFCECDVCWFVFVVDCVLLNKFPYKSSLIFSVERNLRMMDLRGTISLSRVVNTADTLQQGEEPQLHHSSSKPIAGKYWRQTETKGTCAFAILKGEYWSRAFMNDTVFRVHSGLSSHIIYQAYTKKDTWTTELILNIQLCQVQCVTAVVQPNFIKYTLKTPQQDKSSTFHPEWDFNCEYYSST